MKYEVWVNDWLCEAGTNQPEQSTDQSEWGIGGRKQLLQLTQINPGAVVYCEPSHTVLIQSSK